MNKPESPLTMDALIKISSDFEEVFKHFANIPLWRRE